MYLFFESCKAAVSRTDRTARFQISRIQYELYLGVNTISDIFSRDFDCDILAYFTASRKTPS